MISIYGFSDDLVEIEGHVEDEIDCYDEHVVIEVGNGVRGGVRIVMEYATKRADKEGIWSAAISPLHEDVPIPWPVTVGASEEGYSALVKIDCPDDTRVAARKGSHGTMIDLPFNV